MREITKELASELGLREEDGGWVPTQGVELTILLNGGVNGPVTLRLVSRIVTHGDGWILQIAEKGESAWVRVESIMLINAKKTGKSRQDKRAGFA